MASQTPIDLALPSKYKPSTAKATSAAASPHPPSDAPLPTSPSIDWLSRTWTVTHSTLSMWRSARNVRVTYKLLPSKDGGPNRIDDRVEYEYTNRDGVLKSVAGVDTPASEGGWNWRGNGWLFFVSCHWELLGWGESITAEGKTRRWAVTWFAPTLFTAEGIDIYSDCAEGLSQEMYGKVEAALKKLEARKVAEMVSKDLKPVEIRLPWTEKH